MSTEEIRTTPDGREVVITELPDEPRPGETMFLAALTDDPDGVAAELVVRYSSTYPPDRCWMWEVSAGYGRKFTGWRPTRDEVVELGLEDLLVRVAEAADARAMSMARTLGLLEGGL